MSESIEELRVPETNQPKEKDLFSSYYDGLHSRLLLGGEALDPQNNQLPLVDKTKIKPFEERKNDYDIFSQVSVRERKKIVGVAEERLEEAIRVWIEGKDDRKGVLELLRSDFSGSKRDPQTAVRWRQTVDQFLKNLGIEDISKATASDIREKMYNRYFGEKGEISNIHQFITDILSSQENNFQAIRDNIDVYQWLAGMFGINSQELITHLLAAEVSFKQNAEELVGRVNAQTGKKDEKGQPLMRINDLNDEEKRILMLIGKEEKKPQSPKIDNQETRSNTTSPSIRKIIERNGLSSQKRFDQEILRILRERLKKTKHPWYPPNIYDALNDTVIGNKGDIFSEEEQKKVFYNLQILIKNWQNIWRTRFSQPERLDEIKNYLKNKYGDGFDQSQFEVALREFFSVDINRFNSIDDIKKFYHQLPNLGVDKNNKTITWNDIAPIFFQGDTFIHYKPYNLLGKRPSSDVRIYLNPTTTGLAEVIKEILNLSFELQEKGESGIYFKFIDPTQDENTPRIDRLIIYSSTAQLERILQKLKELAMSHPEWFKGREINPMLLPISEGIGIAEDPPSDIGKKFFQKESRVSFTEVRAHVLSDGFRALALSEMMDYLQGKENLTIFDDNGNRITFEGLVEWVKEQIKTVKKNGKFLGDLSSEEELMEELERILKVISTRGKEILSNLKNDNIDSLFDHLFTERKQKVIWEFFLDFLTRIIFQFTPEDQFIERFNRIFPDICFYYQVDPQNLSLNIPAS